ncbi:PBSX family phage terminase large subunit [Lactococcus lactis]|nr:PBSX family phage terminase large subunit [Lactococcus lactis]
MAMDFQNYYFNGGRASTKSSMLSIIIIIMMTQDPNANVVVLRQVANTLRDSVISQLEWAIYELGLGHEFKISKSTLEIVRKSTGQKILFRGADDPQKIKSIKVAKGYIKIIWFEELAEFKGVEGLRSIKQSLGRGGKQIFLYSYNPPRSANNWANQYVDQESVREDTLVHRSTYRTVPKKWLGETFLAEAESLKKTNRQAYDHEYLGLPVGTGGEVFGNIVKSQITDEMVASFDKVYRGLDFGFAADPLAYVEAYYDSARKRLYLFNEIYATGMSNAKAIAAIKALNPNNEMITADSAEPRTIAEFRAQGLNIRPSKKGAGSVDYGIKWLQDINEIIIDPRRTPNIFREFRGYEIEQDKMGNFKGMFPDKDNHTIDSTRYALEMVSKPRKQSSAW